MIDYSKFEVEDFITDESFGEWVKGKSDKHTAFWEFWLEAHPEKKEIVKQARQLLEALKNQPTAINDDEISIEVAKVVSQVEEEQPRLFFPWWGKVAAAAVVALGIGVWFWSTFVPNTPATVATLPLNTTTTKNAKVEVINNTNSDYTASLPDGSTVVLKKGSKVSFIEKFVGDKREVFLTGEGFFNVVRNPAQPFYVYANGLVTRVLGTSFTVRAYAKDKEVIVAVKTGKVMVYSLSELKKSEQNANSQVQSLYLTPTQQATFEREMEKFNKALVDKPTILTKPVETPNFTFENTPIAEVFQRLKTAYGVDIVYDADVMKNCSVTAPLGDESLFTKLTIICKTIGARYEIVETEIVVSGRGCP